MKFPILIFLLFSVFINAQVNFEKGYIIDNNNKKVECYIKNIEWERRPKRVTYKLSENSALKTLSIDQLKEFRVVDTDQFYKRYTITKELIRETFEETGILENVVFLRVLVDGNSDLLEYFNDNKDYFFYEKEGNLIYLEYKKFIDENNIIRENNRFKKQLYDNFNCSNFSLADYSNLSYTNTNLSKFFSNYNKCIGEDYLNVHKARTKLKFNFKLKGGLNLNSRQTNETNYLVSYNIPQGAIEFEQSIGKIESYDTNNNLQFGVELELRLPFHKNNWSLFMAPNYQNISEIDGSKSYSEPNDPNTLDLRMTSNLSYSFIQIPIGFRRYFDVNNKFEIYTHIAYTQNIVLSSNESIEIDVINDTTISFDLEAQSVSLASKNNSGVYFGLGLNFLNKYAVEINYYSTNINLNSKNNASMKGFAINASYLLF